MNKLPPTELPQKKLKTIDQLNLLESINLMIDDQYFAIHAINTKKNMLKIIINRIYEHLIEFKNSRLIYCGAGTSGRIAVQDGVELYPTFGWPKNRLEFIIAGGNNALTTSVENSEDNINDAIEKIDKLKINHKDILIGLAASGNTPFTCKALEHAMKKKALTVGISNNPKGYMKQSCNLFLSLNTGQEVVTGSTRLKAGTSQKICLNIISTVVMIKLGFVKKGYMSNLIPSNKKLRIRKEIIDKILM